MKIGIYSPYLDSISGGEKYILTAASCLSKSNDVSIFWNETKVKEHAAAKLHINLNNVKFVPDIFAKGYPLLKKLSETKKYDAILFLSDGSIPLTLAKKTILHFQFPVEWVDSKKINTILKMARIKKIICNSYFTKRFIDSKFGVNSLVIYPPCINEDDLHLKIEKKENIILTVGRYAPLENGQSVKKFEFMINVFKKMVDHDLQNWKLVLAVSFIEKYRKFVKELELSAKGYPIRIIKNIDYEELMKLYKKSNIYWHAAGFGEKLSQHPEMTEHFGITTVEAMAHGAVPVAINAGGQPEIIDDKINGFLWENEEELINLTKKLMIDNKLRDQMQLLGIKKTEKFTAEIFCGNILNVFK